MKKHNFIGKFISAFVCVILLSSCNSAKDDTDMDNYLSDPKFDTAEPLPQYDHDNTWTHRLGHSDSCATEDTLYFSYIGEYIQYADLATGIGGPLCGKPECSHSGSQCNAYTKSSAAGLSIYDEKLYWIDYNGNQEPTVYCMNLDGTDRTAICSFDRSQYQKISSTLTIAFHRGYAIICGRRGIVEGSVQRYSVHVFSVSLSTGDITEIVSQDVKEGSSPAITAIPYRDMLYLVYSEHTDEQTRLDISTWSFKTHETVLLYSQPTDYILREAWPTEDGLLLTSFSSNGIYQFDCSANEVSLLFDFYSALPQFANDYLISWALTEERIPHIHVTDLEGSVVYSEDLDLPDWPTQGGLYALMGADNGNLYARLELQKDDKLLGQSWLRIVIAQIPLNGGGTVRELWSVERELG